MRVQTVNVIEFDVDNSNLLGITCFSDNKEGNKEAEKHFEECIRENGVGDKAEIEACIEDGFYQGNGYYISITHSS